jgi:hypothetical protein
MLATVMMTGMTKIAQANFRKWNNTLQTKDTTLIVSLYSDKPGALSFLPTMSPEHDQGLNATAVYFEAFIKKNPLGTVTDESVQIFDNGNAYLHSGQYILIFFEPRACLLLQYLLQSCSRVGGGTLEDMCYEGLRAEACVDQSAHHALVNPGERDIV